MNTPTPDYNEPWSIQEGHLSTSLFDGKGAYFADIHELVGEDSSVAWAKAGRIIACVNACAGMADPAKEIAAMREAIQEAHEALKELRSFYIEMTNLPPCAANAALAKLQPFIQ